MSSRSASFLARHLQFIAAAACGIGAAVAAGMVRKDLAFALGIDIAFAVYVLLVVREMPRLTADYLIRDARAADLPVLVIFLITAAAVASSVLSLFQVINSKDNPSPLVMVLALLAIPLGWFTIHAMTALHYAHVFWQDDEETHSGSKCREKTPVGGLSFPDKERPEGWDFLYFSATVGMTSQTSDTDVTTTQMRRIVLLHSIVSFFFNTVIVAAAVNLAVSLGAG
jgi:uncharacterized membrane protein